MSKRIRVKNLSAMVFILAMRAQMEEEVIEKAASLDERVNAAKHSADEMERLIEDFHPFLHARVAKYSYHQNRSRREELFSTAVLAFYESIQSYSKEKGHFFPFANLVINKRIIDHLRKSYKHEEKLIPLEGDEDERGSQTQSMAIENISMRLYETQRRQELLATEIEQFKAELGTWGITMEALSQQSPKHKALRNTYREIVYRISRAPDIMQTIQLKRYFPAKAISNITGIPQKKLERARTFLLASIILKNGDYDLLSEYVKDGR